MFYLRASLRLIEFSTRQSLPLALPQVLCDTVSGGRPGRLAPDRATLSGELRVFAFYIYEGPLFQGPGWIAYKFVNMLCCSGRSARALRGGGGPGEKLDLDAERRIRTPDEMAAEAAEISLLF